MAATADMYSTQCTSARPPQDHFRLLASGRCTALPRHQTLSAALDWSYAFLPRTERAMQRRLAIFSGGFTPEMASAVAADVSSSAPKIVDGVASLVAKLLIAADVSGATPSTAWRCWSARARVADQLGRQIDNVRLALDWAFSPAGVAFIGVRSG